MNEVNVWVGIAFVLALALAVIGECKLQRIANIYGSIVLPEPLRKKQEDWRAIRLISCLVVMAGLCWFLSLMFLSV